MATEATVRLKHRESGKVMTESAAEYEANRGAYSDFQLVGSSDPESEPANINTDNDSTGPKTKEEAREGLHKMATELGIELHHATGVDKALDAVIYTVAEKGGIEEAKKLLESMKEFIATDTYAGLSEAMAELEA